MNNKIKESFQTRKFKSGTYSVGIVSIAVVIVVVINLLVNALPANITKHDLSYNQLYSLTSVTEEFIKGINEDVTIYVMAQIGTEDETVMEMLDNYKALSSHIKVETVDPVLHPNFITQYTSESASNGSLVVVSAKRNTIIPASELYETSINYQTYQPQTTGFDGEGQITSAINYVTTEDIPTAYTLEGHGEAEISDTLAELLRKNSFSLQSLSLYMLEAVPEDADCLIINAPQADLSSDDADKIIAYLEKGGSAMITESAIDVAKPNLDRVLEYYGVGFSRGMVIEQDSSHYFNPYIYYLAPDKQQHDITSDLIKNRNNLFIPFSEAVVKLDSARGTVQYEPLLMTTDNSFLRVLENSASQSISKEEGDIDGPFAVAAAVSEEHGDVETRLVVFGTSYITDDSANVNVNGNNYQMVASSLNWLAEMDSSIAISPKSYSISYLQVTSADVNRWTIITIIVIPAIILVAGFVVWFRRRRK